MPDNPERSVQLSRLLRLRFEAAPISLLLQCGRIRRRGLFERGRRFLLLLLIYWYTSLNQHLVFRVYSKSCMHTYIHTYIYVTFMHVITIDHSFIHTHAYTQYSYIHSYIHICIHTQCIHTYIHSAYIKTV